MLSGRQTGGVAHLRIAPMGMSSPISQRTPGKSLPFPLVWSMYSPHMSESDSLSAPDCM